jgi:hypothetical protein
VIYTASYNRTQAHAVQCGGQLVQQIITALRSRDDASIIFSTADHKLIEVRYNLLLLLAHAPGAPEITLADAVQNYEQVVHEQETASDAYERAIRNAPVPDGSCLDAVAQP